VSFVKPINDGSFTPTVCAMSVIGGTLSVRNHAVVEAEPLVVSRTSYLAQV
jgi:hypothetical protein